ncbi:glycosyltransferase family 2 protein [Asticcacaulis sp. DXS10W]|uniref:Glycosyltransferase family 2 protein n=1 Tax=Asticcacaulis currens TaxID=2984210 RepID=A0ABT5IBH3_9CAUL|nr:glycosyltransferase family 2 protein [Asticcacaulis currens]MDC7692816.1 glycosyltransferase family 2 protein [Asticcacaulis currens]
MSVFITKPRNVDLSSDMGQALKRGRAEQPEPLLPGEDTFCLNGLYKVTCDTGKIEIELTEKDTLERTVAYASPEGQYIILPPGRYSMHYRPIGGARLHLQALSKLQIAKVYLDKALSLGLNPARWKSAWQSQRASRLRAVSIDTNKHRPNFDSSNNISGRSTVIHASERSPEPVSIIIPTKIRFDLLDECIKSIRKIKGVNYEIVIVDNGAVDSRMLDLLARASDSPDIRVFRYDTPFNFSQLCNFGAQQARYEWLLFLNDDVEAIDGTWLSQMCAYALNDEVGAVGARLLYRSGELQHAGIATNLLPGPSHPWRKADKTIWSTHPLISTPGEVDAVTGACLLVSRANFAKIGGFDEVRFPITNNDVDLCLKLRLLGLKIVYVPQATLWHKESQSRPHDDTPEQQARRSEELKKFVELYPDFARRSVFYPDNLRRDTEDARPI